MSIRGIDYAFNPHPSPAAMKSAGIHWVGRYVSPFAVNDSNGKNLIPSECRALLAAGVDIVLFAEQSSGRMLGGHAAGVADANHFDGVTKALGLHGIVMYAAADFDATPGQQGAIDAYLDGTASVLGRDRTGVYGSYYVCKRSADAGKARYLCQTVAWSGGQWEPRAHIRQHLQINVGGVSVDFDEAMKSDFGQYPRDVTAATPPPKPPASPTKINADGKTSFRKQVHAHGTTVNRALWLMSQDPEKVHAGHWGHTQDAFLALDDFDRIPPAGMVIWVG